TAAARSTSARHPLFTHSPKPIAFRRYTAGHASASHGNFRRAAGNLAGAAGVRPYRQCDWRIPGRAGASGVRTGPRRRHGRVRAAGAVSRRPGVLAAPYRLPAGDGVRRRAGHSWRRHPGCGDRHRGLRGTARHDGGARRSTAALDRGGPRRNLRGLPRPCARHRIAGRRRCSCLCGPGCRRHGLAAPRRHRVWPARALAHGQDGGAHRRRPHRAGWRRFPGQADMKCGALALALLLTIVDTANAHAPVPGLDGFPGGLLHPVFVPAHLVALIGLGLFTGHQQHARLLAVLFFAAGLAIGLGAMALAVGETPANTVLLATAAITGALTALAVSMPRVVTCLLAAVTGAAIGLDSPPHVISVTEATLMLIGTGIGALIVLTAI